MMWVHAIALGTAVVAAFLLHTPALATEDDCDVVRILKDGTIVKATADTRQGGANASARVPSAGSARSSVSASSRSSGSARSTATATTTVDGVRRTVTTTHDETGCTTTIDERPSTGDDQ